MISEARLKRILNQFQDQRILVVGDFYLDAYWYIDKTRSTLSLETPWHTNPVVAQRYSPGAAGTVTNNLKALGVGAVYTLGVIGEDGFGRTLLECLQTNGCLTDLMIQVPDWVTPTYLKPMHRGYEGVETEGPRFDIENRSAMDAAVETAVIDALRDCIPLVDSIIVGDQMPIENLGVVTNRVREELCELGAAFPDKIFFADSRTRIGQYRHVIIKPNRFEAKRAVQPGWNGQKSASKRRGSPPLHSQNKPKGRSISPSAKTVSSSTIAVSLRTSPGSPLTRRLIQLARGTVFQQDLSQRSVHKRRHPLKRLMSAIWWLQLPLPRSVPPVQHHQQKSYNVIGTTKTYECF